MPNPLLNLPRNEPCPCGSQKKFKKCHLPTMPRAIAIDQVKAWKGEWLGGKEVPKKHG